MSLQKVTFAGQISSLAIRQSASTHKLFLNLLGPVLACARLCVFIVAIEVTDFPPVGVQIAFTFTMRQFVGIHFAIASSSSFCQGITLSAAAAGAIFQ